MDTRADAQTTRVTPAIEPVGPDASGRHGQPFVNLVREHQEWFDRECHEIAVWVHEQTGIEPQEVKPAPAWLGEDKRVGLLVFRVSVARESDSEHQAVTDWWVVRERSGQRWLYPCLLSTAGDTVRYHHQIRTVQLNT